MMMSSKKLFGVFSVFALFCVSELSAARLFVQPSAIFASPKDAKNVAGVAVAAGIILEDTHSLELEVIRFNSEHKTLPWLKLNYTPVYLTYKYTLPITGALSVYGGVSVGSVYEQVKGRNVSYNVSDEQTAFTFAYQGGLKYALGEHALIFAGVNTLRLKDTAYTASGDVRMIQLGAWFRL